MTFPNIVQLSALLIFNYCLSVYLDRSSILTVLSIFSKYVNDVYVCDEKIDVWPIYLFSWIILSLFLTSRVKQIESTSRYLDKNVVQGVER